MQKNTKFKMSALSDLGETGKMKNLGIFLLCKPCSSTILSFVFLISLLETLITKILKSR